MNHLMNPKMIHSYPFLNANSHITVSQILCASNFHKFCRHFMAFFIFIEKCPPAVIMSTLNQTNILQGEI